MRAKSITATPSQIMVDQLAASGIKHLFYNSGSREALFFDALQMHPDIHGVLSLHEGSVASMAGGYAQTNLDPAVMVVHLGAGLAQCLGQFINIWHGSLPVVVMTFAGDTGSFADRINLDISHSFGPTALAAPLTKATWTVIEPEGLPQAIHRAIQVAKTYPADSDVEALAQAIHEAERPILYVGDGVWKSRAEAEVTALAERFGLPVVTGWGELRSVARKHPLHCGYLQRGAAQMNPDLILCIGVRHDGAGKLRDLEALDRAEQVIAIGSDVANLKSLGGLDLAILADEKRTVQRLLDWLDDASQRIDVYSQRIAWAEGHAAKLRNRLVTSAQAVPQQADSIRPWVLADHLDNSLENAGGGIVTIEQYALPMDCAGAVSKDSRNLYLQAPGASEGWGIGAAIGAKLAAPSQTVVGLVGDGSFCYADSGIWTTAHHNIPLLYVIPNNGAYGIVANSFQRAEGNMARTGEYAGVTLSNIDPVKVAEGFGLEAMHVQEETKLEAAFAHGLKVVNEEQRPFLLNVQLPLGLPAGGSTAQEYDFRELSD